MDFKEIFNTKDTTTEYAKEDIDANKVMGILAYIGILFLIPLFAAKGSKFAQFHTKRGIIICIAAICIAIVSGIISLIPIVRWILGIPLYIVSLIPIAYMVLGIINAAQGKVKELPFFDKLTFLGDFLK